MKDQKIAYKETAIDKTGSAQHTGQRLIRLILLAVLLIVLGTFLVVRSYREKITSPLSASDETVPFSIEEGQPINNILDDLVDSGIINEGDLLYLKAYLKLNDLGSTIQAGDFMIPKDLNMKELVETLQTGQITSVWVTLTEGLRVDEYADILSEALSSAPDTAFDEGLFLSLTSDDNFINSLELPIETSTLEGFLFPDKYLLPMTITTEEVIRTMTENFKIKVPEEVEYEDIVIASLIEREGKTSEERHMISDIIKRRLAEGWFLNIDASLLYYHGDWTYELTVEDLQADHDYNTYVKLGIPPTPICNPGADSIDAAINPIPNDYYYYIHDENGNIHYARTLEEHTANIERHLQ